uniref:Uncharacterized protein n=1 Tax=Bracon brevicornis TaxID=1563983 RepID=A0A6V7L3S1_9HYME
MRISLIETENTFIMEKLIKRQTESSNLLKAIKKPKSPTKTQLPYAPTSTVPSFTLPNVSTNTHQLANTPPQPPSHPMSAWNFNILWQLADQ